MIIDHKSPDYDDVKSSLYETVAFGKVSSLEMISDLTGLKEELVHEAIEELVKEGTLEGSFTEDGKRFFLDNVKKSAAPLTGTHDTKQEVKKANTLTAKLVVITGIIMLVAGQIMRSLIAIHPGLDNAGSAMFMLGLAVLLAGWFQFSRLNPPSNI
jgi:polyhydroxyalkanoate synthesis regulator phasin